MGTSESELQVRRPSIPVLIRAVLVAASVVGVCAAIVQAQEGGSDLSTEVMTVLTEEQAAAFAAGADPASLVLAGGETLAEFLRRRTDPRSDLRPRVLIPRTGQTISYAARDDGALQMGVAWPTPRFLDNLDGTVTDDLTGLVWLQSADCFGNVAWTAALESANLLADGQCGLSDGSVVNDWRLPNIRELHSLVDFGEDSPALPAAHPFSGVLPLSYWSSTTVDDYSPTWAWKVRLDEGRVDLSPKSLSSRVWPVRDRQPATRSGRSVAGMGRRSVVPVDGATAGEFLERSSGSNGDLRRRALIPRTGQVVSHGERDDGELQKGVPWPSPRFTDNLDGTVRDNLTGLVWLQNVNCFDHPPKLGTWIEALAQANELEDGKCHLADGSLPNDWRLPNARELHSLVDFGEHEPALPSGHPFQGVQLEPPSSYWTSTTLDGEITWAWDVVVSFPYLQNLFKTVDRFIWPVRDGERNTGDY